MLGHATALQHRMTAAGLFSCLLIYHPAHAEGELNPVSFGVNRRVVTPNGYVMVTGRFTVEDFFMTTDAAGKFISPSVSIPGTTLIKAVNSKPTFYLGAQQKMPCEAGFQFESEAVSGTVGVDPGWVVFMRWWEEGPDGKFKDDDWIQLKHAVNGSWLHWREYAPDHKVDHKLTLKVLKTGVLALTIDGIGPNNGPVTMYSDRTKPWASTSAPVGTFLSNPNTAVPAFRAHGAPAVGSDIRVRRVVGVTQASDKPSGKGFRGYPDGTRFICRFSEGRVWKFITADPGNPAPKIWSWNAEDTQNCVFQKETGFDVKGKIPGTPPTSADAKYVVEFPGLGDPEISRSKEEAAYSLQYGGKGRYEQESVKFSLNKY